MRFRGAHFGLAHDLNAVRNGFDARVRAAAERVRADEERERAENAQRAERAVEIFARRMCDDADVACVPENRDAKRDRVRRDEHQEDRKNRLNGFFDAANVEDREQHDRGDLDSDFRSLHRIEPRSGLR